MTVSSHVFEIDRCQRGRTVMSVMLWDADGGRLFRPVDFFRYRAGTRMEIDDEDAFDGKRGDTARSSSVPWKSDKRFKAPQPLSPIQNAGVGSRDRMSESEDSTALAGRLTETDESVCAAGSQSAVEVDGTEHWSESDLVLSYPILLKRANRQWKPVIKSTKMEGWMPHCRDWHVCFVF